MVADEQGGHAGWVVRKVKGAGSPPLRAQRAGIDRQAGLEERSATDGIVRSIIGCSDVTGPPTHPPLARSVAAQSQARAAEAMKIGRESVGLTSRGVSRP